MPESNLKCVKIVFSFIRRASRAVKTTKNGLYKQKVFELTNKLYP
jgi:hypothetical protein